MNRLLNSPPKAYESALTPTLRHTIQLGDPIGPETPEQAHIRAVETYRRCMTGERGEQHQKVVEGEARVYGMPLVEASIPLLLMARRQTIEAWDEGLKASFEEIADVLPKRLAQDTANNNQEAAELETLLEGRLSDVWTTVKDPLMEEDDDKIDHVGSGYFNTLTRAIELNYAGFIMAMPRDQVQIERDSDMVAQHEALHALMAIWYDPNAQPEYTFLTNGIDVIEEHGGWINEGTIEKYRSKVFKDDQVGYDAEVLALVVADALDPSFEKARLRAAVLNEKRGEMIGRLELLFGPGAPERVESFMQEVQYVQDLTIYRDKLLTMVPKGRRTEGKVAFDDFARRIFKHRSDLPDLTVE